MYVCLWSPDWSIDAEPDRPAAPRADPAPRPQEMVIHLADHAPRLRAEAEVIWADGRGLDAGVLAGRLLDRLDELGVATRAGVAAVPVAAELAARWGPRDDAPAPTPFMVKERTGFGWRKDSPLQAFPPPPSSPRPSAEDREGRVDRKAPGMGGAPEASFPPSVEDPRVVSIPRGAEATWMSALPVIVLRPDERVRTLLEGVGIRELGPLASLAREAVEVRFGADAVDLWRLARADDRRVLFRRIPPERPHGSIDFVDYVLTDPARLLFTANALLGPLCEGLVGRGEHARALRLTLPLADGTEWERTIRPARPTASRDTWLRLVRGLLDRLTVPDAVAGMRLEVGPTEEAAVRQGDLFDRGFATAAAVEAAVARLAERQVPPVAPSADAHPVLERRTDWTPVDLEAVAARPAVGRATASAPAVNGTPGGVAHAREQGTPVGLALQLLPEPRPLHVECARRRDHVVPLRLRDRSGWREIGLAAGPDRISGGQWEPEPYAREYFRCVTDEGVVLWIYRDARDDRWFLHGWWD